MGEETPALGQRSSNGKPPAGEMGWRDVGSFFPTRSSSPLAGSEPTLHVKEQWNESASRYLVAGGRCMVPPAGSAGRPRCLTPGTVAPLRCWPPVWASTRRQ